MDVQPLHPDPPVAAYPRAAIDDFVANAAKEERRLDEAVADARDRERRARAATAESQATARLLRSTMHELRRELDQRRRQVDAQIDGILDRAFDEAGKILAEARLAARRDAPAAPIAPPTVAAPEEQPSGSGPADPPSVSEAPTTIFPRSEAPIDLTGVIQTRTGLSTVAPVEPTPTGGNGAAAPEPNGNGTSPPAASHSGVPGDRDPRVELDLTSESSEDRRKSPAFGSFLRRPRAREMPAAEPPEPDEFLDFLRGALLDDQPLDAGGDLRWKPGA